MRRLVQQAALHFGARLASVGLSFLLFAWIGKVLDPGSAVKAYSLTYSLGFGLATSRMVLQLGASIRGSDRIAQRMRDAVNGMALLRRLLPLLVIGVAATTWANTHSLPLTVAASVVVLFAAPDIDLLRGATGRASLFSLAFAIGSATAMLLLVFVLPATLGGVVVALLLQLSPVCVINLRTWRRLLASGRVTAAPWSATLGILCLAGFDGLVLNTPFLGLFKLPLAVSLELSLAMRIYVASLPMLPLLLHWANSPAFGQACRRVRLSEQAGFIIGLLGSGILAGVAFIAAYALISHKPIIGSTIFLYLTLLLGFAVFAPQMRFASARWSRAALLKPLAGGLLAFLTLIALDAAAHFPLGAFGVVGLQAFTLLATARWLAVHAPTGGAGDDAGALPSSKQ